MSISVSVLRYQARPERNDELRERVTTLAQERRRFGYRRIRCLTIVDDYTKETLAIEVDTSLSGLRVARVLDRIALHRPLPRRLRVDHGPEFTGLVMDAWAAQRGVKLAFTQPGKPTQNAYVESFNGKFRDECLNDNWFTSLREARILIELWRQDYNQVRPHSSLDNLTPCEFAARHVYLATHSTAICA